MQYVLWALMGWCGTPWPPRSPFPPPPPPNGDPWFTKVVNVVGGIVGGWAYTRLWEVGAPMGNVDLVASSVGAFVGAVLLGDVVGLVRATPKSVK